MGDMAKAIEYGRQSVAYADRRGSAFHRQVGRSTLADALHQAGQLDEAAHAFADAEAIERLRRPEEPILSSMQGYAYCDLLLTLNAFEDAKTRGHRMLEYATRENALLAAALSRLVLGRALLSRACAEGRTVPSEAATHLRSAVQGLRDAGAEFRLPVGLLAHAEELRIRGDCDAARRQVVEALEIAQRGGMKRYEIDCRIELARSALAGGEFAQAAVSVAAAEKMAVRCGYRRRLSQVRELRAAVQRD